MPAYCHQILIHLIIENVKLFNLHILHLGKKKKDQSHIMYPTTPSKKARLPRGYVLQSAPNVYYKEPEIKACVCSALNRILTGTAKVHS